MLPSQSKLNVQITNISKGAIILEYNNQKILIDAFIPSGQPEVPPILNKIKEDIVLGEAPFNDVDLFIMTNLSGFQADRLELRSFLSNYTQNNPQTPIYTTPEIENIYSSFNGPKLRNRLSIEILNQPRLFIDSVISLQQLPAFTDFDDNEVQHFSVRIQTEKGQIVYMGSPFLNENAIEVVETYGPIELLILNEKGASSDPHLELLKKAKNIKKILVLPAESILQKDNLQKFRRSLKSVHYFWDNMERKNF